MSNVGWLPQLGHRTSRLRVSGGPAPAVPPPDANNLKGWLDGGDIDGSSNSTLTNGVTFAAWLNKGTLGGTFDNATPANQPAFSATGGPNGRPAAIFDGADWLVSSLQPGSWTFTHDGTGVTIYTVAKTTTSGVQTILSTCNGGGTAVGFLHRYNAGFAASYAMNDGVALRIAINAPAASVTNGQFDFYASTLALADTPDANIYTNGSASLASANSGGFSSADPSNTLTVGATTSATFALTGPLYQVLIYQGSHDATMRAAVLAWLVSKAGVATFPTT